MDKKTLIIWYGCVCLYCIFTVLVIIQSIQRRKEEKEINQHIHKKIDSLTIESIGLKEQKKNFIQKLKS